MKKLTENEFKNLEHYKITIFHQEFFHFTYFHSLSRISRYRRTRSQIYFYIFLLLARQFLISSHTTFSYQNTSWLLFTSTWVLNALLFSCLFFWCLHDMLVCTLKIFYFGLNCNQGILDLFSDGVQVVNDTTHFRNNLEFGLLHQNTINQAPTFSRIFQFAYWF